jgi:hypothetical protein
MQFEILSGEFSVLKYPESVPVPKGGAWFAARTGDEASLVCETSFVPQGSCAREDGWRGMRVAGQLEFSLVGILAGITNVLSASGISVFCISTYDTDYILVRSGQLHAAADALKFAGYEII